MLSLNLSLSLASGSSRKGNVDKVICLGIFIVCAFADLLVRRSRDFKGLPTSIIVQFSFSWPSHPYYT